MPRCAGIKRDGGRCTVVVTEEQTYCYAHDPSRQAERKRNAARGGKAKATGEIGRVKARLRALADMVEEGQMDRADAAVISQIWNVYLRAISTELKVKEVTELEERLEALLAAIYGRDHRLLPYLQQIPTREGMPGIVRALEGSGERVS